MTSTSIKVQINKKVLIGVFAFVCFAQSNNITSGILAYIIATYPEVPSTMVSAILSFPPIVGTISAFAAGPLINRIGVRKLAIIAQTLQFISGMIFLFLGNKSNIYILWVAAGLYGFILGSCAVICTWMLKAVTSDTTVRGRLMGYNNAVMSLGGALFSYIGGIIAARNNGLHWERAYMLCFLILISIVADIICIPSMNDEGFLVDEQQHDNSKSHLHPKIWIMSIHYAVFFLCLFAFGLNTSEYVISVHHLGSSAEAGFAMSLYTIGGIVSGLTYSLYNRVFKKYTVPFIMLLAAVGLGLCVFFHSLPTLYIAAFCMGFAMLGAGPYIMLEMNRYAEGQAYARATSIFAGLMNAGMMVAVYVLAGAAKIFFGNSADVDGKFTIAFVLSILVCIFSVFLYAKGDSDAQAV